MLVVCVPKTVALAAVGFGPTAAEGFVVQTLVLPFAPRWTASAAEEGQITAGSILILKCSGSEEMGKKEIGGAGR